MAKQPTLNIKRLDPFPARYDTFYNDHFDLRNTLIKYYNIYNIRAYRKSPIPSVIIGANDWLYLTGDEMDSYMGKNRLTAKELFSYKEELEYRKRYLAERNIKFYFLVIPCKASIYSENIGYEYFRHSKETWGEQLNNYLAHNSSIKPIGVFDSLRANKKPNNLFYKLDNHWNDLGAFYTANEVFRRMHQDFPAIEPLQLSDFTIKHSVNPSGNLEKMLGNLGIFSESSVELVPKNGFKSAEANKTGYPPIEGFVYPWDYEVVREIKGSTKPKLLIIGDSFGKNIFPFLSENFCKTVKIFDSWHYGINEPIVESEKPDAVILMIDEPVIRSLLKYTTRRAEK